MNISRGSFDLDYVTPGRRQKQVKARIQIIADGGQRKLQIDKVSNRKSKEVEQIVLEDIGAAVVTKLVCKKRKDNLDLIILWRKADEATGWNITHLRGTDQQLECLEQLKMRLCSLCSNRMFPMKSITEGTLYELQCTRRFIAIIPGTSSLQNYTSISDLSSYISGFIYSKSLGEILLLEQEDSSLIHTVTFRIMQQDKISTFSLCNGKTSDMVSRELGSNAPDRMTIFTKPLPLLPRSLSPKESSNNYSPIPPPRQQALKIDASWMNLQVPAPRFLPAIYKESDALAPYLPKKLEHIEHVCARPPSTRFNEFVSTARFAPSLIDLNKLSGEEIYAPPKLLRRLISDNNTGLYTATPKDNVESTLTQCINKIAKVGNSATIEHCPIGMTKSERQMFCWRLDLVEYDIVLGAGWKRFASHVMTLDADDLEMFDEFSCKYRYQVVELILDHWFKLCAMNSPKCKHPAIKETIIDILNRMERVSLLELLGWPCE